MAGSLSPIQISDLAERIPNVTWRKIAPLYLGLDKAVLSDLQAKYHDNIQDQNEEIISIWANKNSDNQIKVCVISVSVHRRIIIKKSSNLLVFISKSMDFEVGHSVQFKNQ